MRARQPVGVRLFHPRQFFTGANLGFIQDPRVLGSLFEESAGVTPALAGRPVGLVLDTVFNLGRGQNLILNGSFDSDTEWIKETGWTISGGAARKTGASATHIRQLGRLVANRWYEEEHNRTDAFSASINAVFGSVYITSMGNGVKKTIGLANGTGFAFQGGSTEYVVDSVTVREVFGIHGYQASAPSRPIFQTGPARLVFDGVDDSLVTSFPSSLGSACTVARAIPGTGAQILTGQTIGTSFTNTATHAGMVIINRALTSSETANLTRWLNHAAGV